MISFFSRLGISNPPSSIPTIRLTSNPSHERTPNPTKNRSDELTSYPTHNPSDDYNLSGTKNPTYSPFPNTTGNGNQTSIACPNTCVYK